MTKRKKTPNIYNVIDKFIQIVEAIAIEQATRDNSGTDWGQATVDELEELSKDLHQIESEADSRCAK
jgi:hypothetical protein